MDVFVGDPRSADTDLVIVAAFEGEATALSGEWSAPTGGEIDQAIASKEFSGKLFETLLTPIVDRGYRARRLAAIGLGPQIDFTVDRARRAAAAIAMTARQKKIARLAFLRARRARVGRNDSGDRRGADAGGVRCGALQDGRLRAVRADRTRHHRRTARRGMPLRMPRTAGRVIGEHCNMARQLDNEPGNALTPSTFADRLSEIARRAAACR